MKNVLLTKHDKWKKVSCILLFLVFSKYCLGWHNAKFHKLHCACKGNHPSVQISGGSVLSKP